MTHRTALMITGAIAAIFSLANVSVSEDRQCVPAALHGATVFIPVYSHISHGDRLRPFNLALTVSLRNTDAENPVTITKAEYYNEKGKLIRNLIPGALALLPLHSFEYRVKESDVAGGSGGSVIVKWTSERPASPLLAESIMIGTSSAQGISFTSEGRITSFEP